jgi:cytochrome c
VFSQCSGCHPIGDGQTHGIGPDLAGIFNRDIAGAPGYGFSPALRQRGGRWTDDTLTKFLRDPANFAPGTTMVVDGMKNPDELAALVDYLKRH